MPLALSTSERQETLVVVVEIENIPYFIFFDNDGD